MHAPSRQLRSFHGTALSSTWLAGLLSLLLPACSDEGGLGGAAGGSTSAGGSDGLPSTSGGTTGTGASNSGGGFGEGGAGAGTGGEDGADRPTCPLPSSFQWTSSGPLAEPKSPPGANWVSLKDFTIARHDSHYVVYATVWNAQPAPAANREWQGVHYNFSDFEEMDEAPQTLFPGVVAPTLFYFTPKDIWVLAYQWGFQYRTSTNPSDPNSWSSPSSLLSGNPTVGHPPGTGPIDQTVICDDTHCYMFFAADNGYIYRSSMPIEDFPGTFSGADVVLSDPVPMALFEGVQVYKVRGFDQYLMIVEAADQGTGWGSRYYRAFTATDLGGEWTAMPEANTRATPFAGSNNVTFPDGHWSNDISHGDVVRDDPSEKQEIDICNLRFLYQGYMPGSYAYELAPYRPGLLTLVP